MDFTINDRNEWYVRSAVMRGFQEQIDRVTDSKRLIDEAEAQPDFPEWAKGLPKSTAFESLQWLGESYEQLAEMFDDYSKESLRKRIVDAGELFDFVPRGVRA